MKGDGLKGTKYSAVRLLFLFQNDEAQRQAQEKKRKRRRKTIQHKHIEKNPKQFSQVQGKAAIA